MTRAEILTAIKSVSPNSEITQVVLVGMEGDGLQSEQPKVHSKLKKKKGRKGDGNRVMDD